LLLSAVRAATPCCGVAAAGRRPPLPTDNLLPHGAQQQTRHTAAVVEWWDRQTGGLRIQRIVTLDYFALYKYSYLHTYLLTYCAGSANNI